MGSNKNKKRFAGIARKSLDSKFKQNALRGGKYKVGKTKVKQPRNFNKKKGTAAKLLTREMKVEE